MAPIDNMLSERKADCNQNLGGQNGRLASSPYRDTTATTSLAESLGRLKLGIEISTEPCLQAPSMNRQLRNLMRQMNGMSLNNSGSSVCVDKHNTNPRAAKTEATIQDQKIKVEIENAETETKTDNVTNEVKKETSSNTDIKTHHLKLLEIHQKCIIAQRSESHDEEDQLGELVARGPDRNRSKDGRQKPYWHSSSSSSSPESIVESLSPEGSPQSIVFDTRRQSGGSITLCRTDHSNFDLPESPPVPERIQNHQYTYRHKCGGGAIQVIPPPGIAVPNSQQFMDSSHGSSYTTSPAHYSVPSPPVAFSPSRSPLPSVVPSPSQTPFSSIGSPSLYRDMHCQSSPDSFVAYSPAQESVGSPYSNSSFLPSLEIRNPTLVIDQMEDICLTSQACELTLLDSLLKHDDSQMDPADVQDPNDEFLINELEQFIDEHTSDKAAPPDMVKIKVNEIMNMQDQTNLTSNQRFGAQPNFVEMNLRDAVLSSGFSAASTITVSTSTASLPAQQPRSTLSHSSAMNVATLSISPNNHPMLTSMLNTSPDSGPPRTPVTLIVHPQKENWIPDTVNTGGSQIVPVMKIVTTPVPASPPVIGRPRRQVKPPTPKITTPVRILPKPSLTPAPNISPVVSPVGTNEPVNHPGNRATREEVHAKLLEKFDDCTRMKMNQAIQSIPDDKLFKRDAIRGDTMAHMAILKKQKLLSVNLVDRFVQKSPSNLKIENNLGQTLLTCAALTQQEDLVEYLLLSGADPNQQMSSFGSTILHFVSERGASFARVLEKVCSFPGANVNKHNSDGRTPLLCAIESHGKQVSLDLSSIITIDAVPIIRTLLGHGASLAVPCRCAGKTGLHVAVQKKNYVLAQLLCSDSPRIREAVNIQAFDGNTCLHYAAGMSEWTMQDQLRMVKLLLQNGAVVTETNNESKIPTDLVDRDRKEVKKLLKPPGGRRGSST